MALGLIAAAVDAVSVAVGPSRSVVEDGSEAFERLAIHLPPWDARALVGLVDVVFLGLFVAGAARVGLRPLATAVGTVTGLVIALRHLRGKAAEAAVTWGNVLAAAAVVPLVAGDLVLTPKSLGVLLFLGIFQIALSFRIKPLDGWGWILAAGIIAFLAGFFILMQYPTSGLWVPGTLAGISLIFTGWSYIALSLAAKRSLA